MELKSREQYSRKKQWLPITKKVKTTNLNTRTLYNEGKNVSAGLAKGIKESRGIRGLLMRYQEYVHPLYQKQDGN